MGQWKAGQRPRRLALCLRMTKGVSDVAAQAKSSLLLSVEAEAPRVENNIVTQRMSYEKNFRGVCGGVKAVG